MWTIKLTGLIKCLRVLFRPLDKHEFRIRSLLLALPPHSIQLFYADTTNSNNPHNMSFVYQYGRLQVNYCGVTKRPMDRIWQHILAARFAAFGCTKSVTHYRRVAQLDCEFFYAFIPLAYVPNRTREHYERFIIHTFKYNLNYVNFDCYSLKRRDTPNRKGFYSRLRSTKPHLSFLPTLSSSRVLDLSIYTSIEDSNFNPRLDDLLRTTERVSNLTIHVSSGAADATDWYQIQEFFGSSMITTPTGFTTTLPSIQEAIKKKCFSTFTITKLVCPKFYCNPEITYSALFSSLSNKPQQMRIAKLYAYLDASTLIYNTRERKRARNLLYRAFQQFKIRMPPQSLSIRVQYPQMIHKETLVQAGRYLVQACSLPASAKHLIYSRTTIVNKGANTIGDICCNNLRWSPLFDINEPWPCCMQCKSMPHLPHRDTYGNSCLAFRADEYHGPFSDVLKLNLRTIPHPDRHSVFHGLVTGLLSFNQHLQRFTNNTINVTRIKELSSQCIRYRMPTLCSIHTSRVKSFASEFDGCVRYGLDKNTKMLFVCCPHFHWHLIRTTFEFAATGHPSAGLNYTISIVTPAQYLRDKRETYKWTHIAPFKLACTNGCPDRLALADAVQKYTKDKGRPMIRCHREPERLLKSRVCKAGFFILTHSKLDHFGITNTRLSQYSSRWKYRESLGTTAQVLDDMSGFYTCLDRSGVLQRAQYILEKFKRSHRRGKHWISVPRRGKSTPKFGKTTNCDDFVSLHVDDIYEILVWASQFSNFKLGRHFLTQVLGLFQGCALSVILALYTAAADEDRWLSSLGNDRRLIYGFRYFDDRCLWILYFPLSTTSRSRATELKHLCTTFYMHGIECEPEPPPCFLESIITELPNGTLDFQHNNKNWDNVLLHRCQSIYSQLPRCSYQFCSIIDGYRISRLKSVITHSNTTIGKTTAAIQQVTEWHTCLQDEFDDILRVLKCLLRNPPQKTRDIWHAVMTATVSCFSHQLTVPPADSDESECSFTTY